MSIIDILNLIFPSYIAPLYFENVRWSVNRVLHSSRRFVRILCSQKREYEITVQKIVYLRRKSSLPYRLFELMISPRPVKYVGSRYFSSAFAAPFSFLSLYSLSSSFTILCLFSSSSFFLFFLPLFVSNCYIFLGNTIWLIENCILWVCSFFISYCSLLFCVLFMDRAGTSCGGSKKNVERAVLRRKGDLHK